MLNIFLIPLNIYFYLFLLTFLGNTAEIIVSGGMTMPQTISPLERVARQNDRIPLNRIN